MGRALTLDAVTKHEQRLPEGKAVTIIDEPHGGVAEALERKPFLSRIFLLCDFDHIPYDQICTENKRATPASLAIKLLVGVFKGFRWDMPQGAAAAASCSSH
jgi:hypothetical protein